MYIRDMDKITCTYTCIYANKHVHVSAHSYMHNEMEKFCVFTDQSVTVKLSQ